MASIFSEDFEGGTNGATCTTSNTGADLVAGSPTFQNSQVILGSLGMYCHTTSSVACGLRYDYSARNVMYARFYLYFVALPTNNTWFFNARDNTTVRAEFRWVASSDTFQLRNGTTAVWTSGLTPTTGKWYRIEYRMDRAAGQQQVRIYSGANLHGSTPDEDSGNVTFNSGTTFDNSYVGSSTAANGMNFYIDEVQTDSATWVGPLAMGTDHTQGATDGIGLADGLTSEGAFLRSFGDTAVTESGVIVSAGFAREIADDAVTADDASASIELLVSVTDDVDVEDEVDDDLTEAGTDWTETIDEDAGITDGSAALGFDGVGTDPVNVTDSVTAEKSSLVEDLGITDGSPQVGLAGEQTDPVAITDMITTTKTATTSFIVTITDSLVFTESEVGTKAFDVAEEEGVFDTEDFQVAFTPAPVTGVEEELGILDDVAVEHGIEAGFNWIQDQDDTVNVSDSVLVDHTVFLNIVRTFTDPVTFHDTVDLTFTAAPNSPALTFTDLLIAVDSVVAGVVTIPPGLVRVVIRRSIRGPRCEDWFWRHYPFLPQPAQVALLIYPDGRVLETDDLLSEQARTAPFIAGGGYQTIIESDSWQAQVLSAAGYELEPVT